MTGRVWIGDDESSVKRVRPATDKLVMPRGMRRAELVCSSAGARPMLLAIIYPRDVAADRLQVLTQREGGGPLGRDLELPCRCSDSPHRVDGGLLRAAVLSTSVRGGRVPTVDVVEVNPA